MSLASSTVSGMVTKIFKASDTAQSQLDLSGIPLLDLCFYIALLVGARMKSDLSATMHNIPSTHEAKALIAALRHHCNETGCSTGEETIDTMKAGYFKKAVTMVTCNLDQGEPKNKLESENADEVSMKNTLDCMSFCVATTGGREMKIDTFGWSSIMQSCHFHNWKWTGREDMFKDTKLGSETPKKIKADSSPGSAQASASAAFASKESQMLGDALRRKLAPKPSPTKKGDGNSASSNGK